MDTKYWKGISVALIITLFVANLGWAKELSEKISIQTENAQLKSQIAAFQREVEQLKNKVSLLENKNQELLKEREKLLERIKVLEDQIVKLNSIIAALQEEIERSREKQIETVKLESPIFALTGENRVDGFKPFYDELHIRIEASAAGGYRLIEELETFVLQRSWRTLIFAIPPSFGGIEEYREVEEKYPDLTPISSAQIERFIQKYGVPFLYFTRGSNNRIIGVIVANSVDANLAKLIVEKVILNALFRYEDGEIKILKD